MTEADENVRALRPEASGETASAAADAPDFSRRDMFGLGLALAAVAPTALAGQAAAQATTPKPAPSSPVTALAPPPLSPTPAPEFSLPQVAAAEAIDALAYTDKERAQLLKSLEEQTLALARLRAVKHDNALAPASVFSPKLPGAAFPAQARPARANTGPAPAAPKDPADIAFAPAAHLGRWIASGALTSREVTEIYLDRIARYAPKLENFITVTADRARAEADLADKEIKARRLRGPLHGVPYALKDLFDAAGVRTSWGAEPYKDRVAQTDSAVVRRLKAAGCVLLGKTAVGALAYGDIWFGGVSRNPWNPLEGSSGSSAGSASATAAGLCGFSIGTETLGSIVSPSERCGVTGLRPTFGRVSRAGAMALCWSLDKAGALCRSAEDSALVLAALNGYDPDDAGSIDHGFSYEPRASLAGMKIGYDPAWFEGDGANDVDRAALEAVRSLGASLAPFKLVDLPYDLLGSMVEAEAAAAFAELTLENKDDLLRWQDDNAWPNIFRRVRFFPAVDYVQIDRLRRKAMLAAQEAFKPFDAVIGPNFAGPMLLLTNFTGQPCLCLRAGFVERTPRTLFDAPIDPKAKPFRATHNISIWADLFEERQAIALGHALERRLDVASARPPGFG